MTDIVNTITEQISQHCQCTYTSNLIINGQLFCDDDQNQLIYQAQFLKSSGKTPDEIRRLILYWVFTEPFILIDSQLYELDSSCSVIVQTLGNSTCVDPSSITVTIPKPEATPRIPSSFELATISGVAVLIIIVISLIVYIGVRRSRKKAREQQREQTPR